MITTRAQLEELAQDVRGRVELGDHVFVGFAPGNFTIYPMVFAPSPADELGYSTGYAERGTYVGFTHGHHSGYVFKQPPALGYVSEKLNLRSVGDARPVTLFIALVMGANWTQALRLAEEQESAWR